MTGLNNSGYFSDTVNTEIVQNTVVVTTTQVEAKAGANRLKQRQIVRIFNKSSSIVYFGPTGVTASTGEPLYKDQWVDIPLGQDLPIYMIVASGSHSVVVTEFA